jgi:hypothetical protein
MPTATPHRLDHTLANSRRRLSVIDMRPPCKALASIGSTTSVGRTRRITMTPRPRIRPPSAGTHSTRPTSIPIPVLSEWFAGNPEDDAMGEIDELVQAGGEGADQGAEHGADQDLRRLVGTQAPCRSRIRRACPSRGIAKAIGYLSTPEPAKMPACCS